MARRAADRAHSGAIGRVGVPGGHSNVMAAACSSHGGVGAGATVVSENSDGQTSSFFVIEAENSASALVIAATCPGIDPGRIDLREIDSAKTADLASSTNALKF